MRQNTQDSSHTLLGGVGLTGKRHEETFWDDCNVLSFVKSLGYRGVCICKNSANLYLTFVHFVACKCTSKILKTKQY